MPHGFLFPFDSATQPALLVGLWMLLQIQHTLANCDQELLQKIANYALPRAGPASEDV